jgi:hypothetical protein
MEIKLMLEYGPIDAEFIGDDREELESEFESFLDFVNENSDRLNGLEVPESREMGTNGAGQSANENGEASSTDGSQQSPLASLARKADTTTKVLNDIVYVDPDKEEDPQVLIDKGKLGSNKTERQRTAAYILLRIWEDCYDEERMDTSKLMNILAMSGISDNDLYNAWKGPGKGDFDSRGKGSSATVGLTGPGKRKALKVLKDLSQEHSS